MDVLLVYPRSFNLYFEEAKTAEKSKTKATMPPLGILYIAAQLETHDFNVNVVDMEAQDIYLPSLLKKVSAKMPEVIGFSITTENYNYALLAAKKVKELNHDAKVILGGPHVSFAYKDAILSSPTDVIVYGEGEVTCLELAEYFVNKLGDLKRIRGIFYKEKKSFHATPPRPFIRDLDALAFPSRHLIDLSAYSIPGSIISSRGCPMQCTYCASGAMAGGIYRTRSPENFVAEMIYLRHKYKLKRLEIDDDAFTVYEDRVQKICKLIKETGLDISWNCKSRVDCISKNTLKVMKSAGCDGIKFGIESGDERVLKSIRKNITLKQAEMAVRLTTTLGLRCECSFMLGHPPDTTMSIQKTVKFADYLRTKYGAHIYLAINTPFPGTYQFNHAEELGMTIVDRNWDNYFGGEPVFKTKYLAQGELKRRYFDAVSLLVWGNDEYKNKSEPI